MEDPKAWKPRKARHRNRKDTRTEKPTLGKNGIQSHASRLVGQIITMVWSRPWATKNGMCWEASGKGLEEASEQQASLG